MLYFSPVSFSFWQSLSSSRFTLQCCCYVNSHIYLVNSALNPSRLLNWVPDLIIDCGRGRNVTSARWQVTLCDVNSNSGEACLRTAVLCLFFTLIILKLITSLLFLINCDIYESSSQFSSYSCYIQVVILWSVTSVFPILLCMILLLWSL